MVATKHLQKAAEILGAPIVKTEPLGGGCIAQTEKWHTADGQVVVAKTGGGQAMSFLMEANGLKELQKAEALRVDRKSTRLNSSHVRISYAVFCLKKKKKKKR